MPTKPTKTEIDAAKRKYDPRDVVRAIINETPELKEPAIAAGVVVVKEDDYE